MSDPGCFPSDPREGPHSSTGRIPLSHAVWEPPLWDTVMCMCPCCDSVDSRGGLVGGSQERKAQESQASHLEMSFLGTVLSGLAVMAGVTLGPEHTGGRGRMAQRRQRELWTGPGFGTAHPGPACPSRGPLRSKGKENLLCSHEGLLWWLMQVKCGGNFETPPSSCQPNLRTGDLWGAFLVSALDPKHESGVRLNGKQW